MLHCTCEDWKNNLTPLNTCVMIATVHGLPYRGAQFRYCPWCGQKLIDEAPIDQIKTIRMPQYMNGVHVEQPLVDLLEEM